MKIRRHTSKSGQPSLVVLTGTVKSGSIPPTYEQVQSGTGNGVTSGAVLANFLWAVLINK